MSETHRRLLTWAAGPLVLVLLLGWAVLRVGSHAEGAQRAWAELRSARVLAEQIAELDGGHAADDATSAGLFGRVQSVADGAGIMGGQLANLERVEPAFGEDSAVRGARVDLRRVSVTQVVAFLEAWADSGLGRGARSINLIPEGDDYDDLWTAQLRLDG